MEAARVPSLGLQLRTRPWGGSHTLVSMEVIGPVFSEFSYPVPFFPEMLVFLCQNSISQMPFIFNHFIDTYVNQVSFFQKLAF